MNENYALGQGLPNSVNGQEKYFRLYIWVTSGLHCIFFFIVCLLFVL